MSFDDLTAEPMVDSVKDDVESWRQAVSGSDNVKMNTVIIAHLLMRSLQTHRDGAARGPYKSGATKGNLRGKSGERSWS
jgi:hypothetical protein